MVSFMLCKNEQAANEQLAQIRLFMHTAYSPRAATLGVGLARAIAVVTLAAAAALFRARALESNKEMISMSFAFERTHFRCAAAADGKRTHSHFAELIELTWAEVWRSKGV